MTTIGPLERLLTLYRAMGTVRSVLDRVVVTRTKDHDDQDRMLRDWQAELSLVLEQLATGAGAPAGPQDWQPMSTAPRDGTTILLALNDYNIASVDFGWHNGDYWRNYENAQLYPTRWQPLPPPPVPPAGTGEQP